MSSQGRQLSGAPQAWNHSKINRNFFAFGTLSASATILQRSLPSLEQQIKLNTFLDLLHIFFLQIWAKFRRRQGKRFKICIKTLSSLKATSALIWSGFWLKQLLLSLLLLLLLLFLLIRNNSDFPIQSWPSGFNKFKQLEICILICVLYQLNGPVAFY